MLTIRATRVGGASTLSQIVQSVEVALSTKAPVESVADRVSRWFVPAVIVVSAVAFGGGIWFGLHPGASLMRAIAVLVIACPCALGIATPLAITAAVGAASTRGILVSNARVFEQFRKVDLVVLDKTGTLTEGNFQLLATSVDTALPLVAALERCSGHPIARTIVRHVEELGLPIPEAHDVVVHPGQGIEGVVEGGRVVVGNRTLVPPGSTIEGAFHTTTVVYAAVDGVFRGWIALGDRIRPDAAGLVSMLRAGGIETLVVSGDSRENTASVARDVGATAFFAEVLPAGKAEIIREHQKAGKVVAMIGDGVNDVPALAAADIGIALGHGTDLTIQAAPVVLMAPRLAGVLEIFTLSRRTLQVVRQNLFWAFFYNCAGMTLAITGLLNPILAAGAMVLSSLSVIGNSLRLYENRRVQS